MHLPLAGDVAGPSVLRAQILLNRALFSPGIIDGRWGANTEKAVYWFQHREGLPATSRLDQATFDRLTEIAGGPAELIRAHRLTEREVAGPFVTIPRDIYAHAELHCSCYESLGEKLAERFHTSQEMLRRLNPGTELSTVVAGQILYVPNVRPEHTAIRERVRELLDAPYPADPDVDLEELVEGGHAAVLSVDEEDRHGVETGTAGLRRLAASPRAARAYSPRVRRRRNRHRRCR
jgi:hypothetical protein